MMAYLFIALAGGCAAALMFASVASGAAISLLLFYLAPLPLMVVAIGWGALLAIISGGAVAIGLGLIFSLPYGIAFAAMVALPAGWLGRLALLGRPQRSGLLSDSGAAPDTMAMEWYPVGRILLWIAGFAALTTMGALLTLGQDAPTITAALRSGLLQVIGASEPAALGDIELKIDMAVSIAPAAAGIVAMLTLLLNLWLAAKITAISGRLHRPWPELKNADLPSMTLAALCAAIAFCFTGGLPAMLAEIVTALLMTAYALAGFAVLHTLTMTLKARAIWLCCAYAAVMATGWPILAMVALGIADSIFGLRQRYRKKRSPPPLPAS